MIYLVAQTKKSDHEGRAQRGAALGRRGRPEQVRGVYRGRARLQRLQEEPAQLDRRRQAQQRQRRPGADRGVVRQRVGLLVPARRAHRRWCWRRCPRESSSRRPFTVAFRRLADLDVRGKRVLVREDLNVPMNDGAIVDDTRIEAARPDAALAAPAAARARSCSRTSGGPTATPDPRFSLRPLAQALADRLGVRVAFAGDCVGEAARGRRRASCATATCCCSRTCASIPKRSATIRPSRGVWPSSAISTSTTPSGPRTARTPRPRRSRICFRARRAF